MSTGLTFTEVRAARCPACVSLGSLTYVYRPYEGDVVVYRDSIPRQFLTSIYAIPLEGWLYEAACSSGSCTCNRQARHVGALRGARRHEPRLRA